MKILLINAPIRLDAQPNCIPYGLATIASILQVEGFDVEIYDINALRPSDIDMLAALRTMHWDVVGISGLVTTYAFQKRLISILKILNPKAPVVCGGGLATSSSNILFQNTDVDITVRGEGERTMLELSRVLADGGDLTEVPGICFRKNGQIIQNKPRSNIANLNTVPFPAWDLLPMEVYLQNPIWGAVAGNSSGFRSDIPVTRSMNIIGSRGCPFACRYCYHLFGRSSYRLRSAENMVAEVEILVDRYGVDFIGFVDDNMMASEKRLLEFCDLMLRKQLPVTWGCHGRVSSATPDVLPRMAAAGCVWIGYGIESASQKILNAMNKGTTVAQARQAIIDTRRAGIYPNTTFIFGYPGETVNTVQETIEFKKELGLTCGSFFATPYPGTPLYNQIKQRIENEGTYISMLGNATDFTINLTEFDDATLFRLKNAMDSNKAVF